ncbi:MAG: hypothetical protein K5930_07635 [Treponemataceae bacterium]|nr:hypothetical protein [Treponemataceae bacterium]
MKKVLLLVLTVYGLLLTGCNNKAMEELQKKNTELEKKYRTLSSQSKELSSSYEECLKQISDLTARLDTLEERINTIEKERLIAKTRRTAIRYDHKQTVNFKYGGYDTKIYKEPLGEEVIYTVQTGDKIQVTAILVFETTNEGFLEVKTPTEVTGYIAFLNPFKDGSFLPIYTLTVDGKNVTILKMENAYHVTETFHLRTLPSDNSESIHVVTHKEGMDYYWTSAITEDYEWVKIKLNEYEGWVKTQALSVDKGGPLLNTPEAMIEWVLIDVNMI